MGEKTVINREEIVIACAQKTEPSISLLAIDFVKYVLYINVTTSVVNDEFAKSNNVQENISFLFRYLADSIMPPFSNKKPGS